MNLTISVYSEYSSSSAFFHIHDSSSMSGSVNSGTKPLQYSFFRGGASVCVSCGYTVLYYLYTGIGCMQPVDYVRSIASPALNPLYVCERQSGRMRTAMISSISTLRERSFRNRRLHVICQLEEQLWCSRASSRPEMLLLQQLYYACIVSYMV